MNSDNSTDSVSLSPEEVIVISEIRQAIRDLEQRIQGALIVILRQRGLEGADWALNGGVLTRAR